MPSGDRRGVRGFLWQLLCVFPPARLASLSQRNTAAQRASRVGARLFAKRGYAATTTRELSRGLGITNGTFYHHFATKEDLLKQICEESLDRITGAVKAAVQGCGDPAVRIEALIHAHVRTMLADQDLHKTMLMEIRSLNGVNRAEVLAKRADYSTFITTVIAGAQTEGTVRSDLSPKLLTLLLLNLLNWTIIWYKDGGELKADELAAAITAVFLDGSALGRLSATAGRRQLAGAK